MDAATMISLTGSFLKSVGECVADLKREKLAKIDIELLNLKRALLAEELDDYQRDLHKMVSQEQARVRQDLMSRGLGSSTVVHSALRAIAQDASTESDRASREYNRAIEEIALLERKAKEHAQSLWRTPLRCLIDRLREAKGLLKLKR